MCPQSLDAASYIKCVHQVTGDEAMYMGSYEVSPWSFGYTPADEDRNLSWVSDASYKNIHSHYLPKIILNTIISSHRIHHQLVPSSTKCMLKWPSTNNSLNLLQLISQRHLGMLILTPMTLATWKTKSWISWHCALNHLLLTVCLPIPDSECMFSCLIYFTKMFFFVIHIYWIFACRGGSNCMCTTRSFSLRRWCLHCMMSHGHHIECHTQLWHHLF